MVLYYSVRMDWKDEGGGCDVRRNPFISFSESESEGLVGDDVKDGKCEVAKVKREPDVKTRKQAYQEALAKLCENMV